MIATRNIADLHPIMQPLCKDFLRKAEENGLGVLITCTYRDGEEQNRLYALGRTKKSHIGVTEKRPLGLKVTNAKAGESAHNFELNGLPASKAFDFVPLFGGKPVWDEKSDLWQKLGKIAIGLGLEWYGEPNAKFKEFPHVQLKS